jgi:hypothetical protein
LVFFLFISFQHCSLGDVMGDFKVNREVNRVLWKLQFL